MFEARYLQFNIIKQYKINSKLIILTSLYFKKNHKSKQVQIK